MDRIIHSALCAYRQQATEAANAVCLDRGALHILSLANIDRDMARYGFEPRLTESRVASLLNTCAEGSASALWTRAQYMREAALADAALPNGPHLTQAGDAAFWQGVMDAVQLHADAEEERNAARMDALAHERFCDAAYGTDQQSF